MVELCGGNCVRINGPGLIGRGWRLGLWPWFNLVGRGEVEPESLRLPLGEGEKMTGRELGP